MVGWITWDWAGPLGGKCRTVGQEGRRVVLASRHLEGCSPHLCRLWTNGLAPVSKYWTYRSHVGDLGLVNLVACHRQMFGFHYCFNGCFGRETGWQTCGSLSRAGGCVQRPFSQELYCPSNAVDGLWKVAMYVDCPQEACAGRTWTGVGSVSVVCIGCSPAWYTSI
jgi:hypothetical protein